MKNQSRAQNRWIVLFFCGLASIGIFYFHDAIYPLKETLITEFAFNNYDFGFVVASYSLPSIFLAMGVIAGLLIDKFGTFIVGIIFAVVLIFGSLIILYSTSDTFNEGGILFDSFDSFWAQCSPAVKLMALGLFVFGMGAESLLLVFTRLLIDWFRGRELAFALAMTFTSSKVGEALGLAGTSYLQEKTHWKFALDIGFIIFIICILLFVASLFYKSLKPPLASSGESEGEDKVQSLDLIRLLKNPLFICLAIISITITAAYDPFISFGADWLQAEYQIELKHSAALLSLMLILTAILTPIFGILVDKKKMAPTFVVLGLIIFLFVFLMMLVKVPIPTLLMILSGIALSLIAASLYPLIVESINPKVAGTAFGIIIAAENLGVWSSSLAMGQLLETFNPGAASRIRMMEMIKLNYIGPEILVTFLFSVSLIVFLVFLYIRRKRATQI